jgi:Zn finger protein HypA/HybF involved in hydrogenase expression
LRDERIRGGRARDVGAGMEVWEMDFKCPGSKQFTEPKPEFVPCPLCHGEVEMWTDEAEAKCDNCGSVVSRERLQGCIDHCSAARECLGEELYARLLRARAN